MLLYLPEKHKVLFYIGQLVIQLLEKLRKFTVEALVEEANAANKLESSNDDFLFETKLKLFIGCPTVLDVLASMVERVSPVFS